MNSIRLLVFDIDGVLTQGEARALDRELLARLAALNRASRADPSRPAATLCTGRPAPYVEVLLQAIDGHLPAVFENGCGLYVPRGYRFLSHPKLADPGAMPAVRERLQARLVRTGQAFVQPGKEFSLSLFPLNSLSLSDLVLLTDEALGPLRESVDLVNSASCLNILPRGVDKGEGLRFLCDQAGFSPDDVLGVGDSEVDLPFLSLAGQSAAPANAVDEVKRIVDFVAARAAPDGVRDILAEIGLWE